jgi:hypothetical protein
MSVSIPVRAQAELDEAKTSLTFALEMLQQKVNYAVTSQNMTLIEDIVKASRHLDTLRTRILLLEYVISNKD